MMADDLLEGETAEWMKEGWLAAIRYERSSHMVNQTIGKVANLDAGEAWVSEVVDSSFVEEFDRLERVEQTARERWHKWLRKSRTQAFLGLWMRPRDPHYVALIDALNNAGAMRAGALIQLAEAEPHELLDRSEALEVAIAREAAASKRVTEYVKARGSYR